MTTGAYRDPTLRGAVLLTFLSASVTLSMQPAVPVEAGAAPGEASKDVIVVLKATDNVDATR